MTQFTYISRTVFSCSSLDFFSSISQSLCCPSSANNCRVMSSTSCGRPQSAETLQMFTNHTDSVCVTSSVQTNGSFSDFGTCSCFGFFSFSFPVLYPPYFSNRSKNLGWIKGKFNQQKVLICHSRTKVRSQRYLHGVTDFHLHLLFRRSVSVSDDGDDTAQFHPEEYKEKLGLNVHTPKQKTLTNMWSFIRWY